MQFYFVLIYLFVIDVSGQDCKVRGKKCSDDEQCCGGCCFDGECVDTYRSCLTPFDVCKDHPCVGEENCFAYKPPECHGCEPLPLCILK
ncbi:unnamed protein product [Parnassius mnemosyne]|uniref:Uncharacterized protein n=1 Tax=Parnassius mnemosyne TaxID=213953 RepID=A0AAV1KXE6_9NEOP